MLRRYLNLLSEIEDLKNVLIALITDGTEKSCYRQLLLTVNVCEHDIVDVSSKLNPRTLERNDTSTVQCGTVSMHTLTKEHARRTVQLCHDNALSTIDNKSTIICHVRNRSKEHILDERTKVLMIRIGAIKLHLSLQGDTVCQASLETFIDGVTGRIDIVVEELEHEIITRVCDREVLSEHLVQTVVLTLLRRRVKLKEIAERLQLHVQEIREWVRIRYACEIDSVVNDL